MPFSAFVSIYLACFSLLFLASICLQHFFFLASSRHNPWDSTSSRFRGQAYKYSLFIAFPTLRIPSSLHIHSFLCTLDLSYSSQENHSPIIIMSHAANSRRYKDYGYQNEGFGGYIDSLSADRYDHMKESYYSTMPNEDCILFEYQVYIADYSLFAFMCSNPHAGKSLFNSTKTGIIFLTFTAPAHGLRACCFDDWLQLWLNAEAQEAWEQDNPSANQRPGPRRRTGRHQAQDTEESSLQQSGLSDISLMNREMEFERHPCLYGRQREGTAEQTNAGLPNAGTSNGPLNVPSPPVPSSNDQPPRSTQEPAPLRNRSPSPSPTRSTSEESLHSDHSSAPPSPRPPRGSRRLSLSPSPSPARSIDDLHSTHQRSRSASPSNSDANRTGGAVGSRALSRGRGTSRSSSRSQSGSDSSPGSRSMILRPGPRRLSSTGSGSPDGVHSGDESPVSPGVRPPWGTPSRDGSRDGSRAERGNGPRVGEV